MSKRMMSEERIADTIFQWMIKNYGEVGASHLAPMIRDLIRGLVRSEKGNAWKEGHLAALDSALDGEERLNPYRGRRK